MATAANDERLAEQEQTRQEALAEERTNNTYAQRLRNQVAQKLKQKAKEEVKKWAAKTFIQWFIANQWWLIWVELGVLIAFLLFLTIFAICTSKNVLVQAGVWVAGFNDLCKTFRQ